VLFDLIKRKKKKKKKKKKRRRRRSRRRRSKIERLWERSFLEGFHSSGMFPGVVW
jgi:hypothetical protein